MQPLNQFQIDPQLKRPGWLVLAIAIGLLSAALVLAWTTPAPAQASQAPSLDRAAAPNSGPPTSLDLAGPAMGDVGAAYVFTATVGPPTATLPMAYVWRATEQAPFTDVGDRLTSTVTYTWTSPGAKTITVTASNASGAVDASHVITIASPAQVAPLSVTIDGPPVGDVDAAYTFTATVGPPTATLPMAYVWRATEQPSVTRMSDLTSTVTYTWIEAGPKTVTVTVSNDAGSASGTHVITVQSTITPAVPPATITLWAGTVAGTNNPVWVQAQVSPPTLTTPITYTWQASQQTPITFVRTSTYDALWSQDGGFSDSWTWAPFTWSTLGPKVITLTASNTGGSLNATHTLTISLAPSVVLTGSTVAGTGPTYTYTATVSPPTTALPIYYSWYASDQPYAWGTGSLSDTFTATWSTSGTKVVQVWANNIIAGDQDALLVDIPSTYPPLTPTIESAGDGDWSDPATWNLSRAPVLTDVVLIHTGHTVSAPMSIQIDSLVNQGTLMGTDPQTLLITATHMLSNSGWIKAADGSASIALNQPLAPSFHPACNGTSGTPGANLIVAATTAYNNGTLQAGDGLNGGFGGDLSWTPSPLTSIWNDTGGLIRAGDGGNGLPGGGGGPGGDVTLTGTPFNNDGAIQAGHGGDGDQCGGDGGNTYVFAENSTNTGSIDAGDGGDTADDTATAHGGDGGDTEVWGKFFTGSGFLVNLGSITAGDGGDGSPTASTNPQDAGCGGNLTLMAAPNVFLGGGSHAAGMGGTPSAGGRECGDGEVWIDPSRIHLAGEGTMVRGGEVAIYGGDDWTLDLRDLNRQVISASGGLTLAVGANGVIDLSGNSQPLAQTDDQVRLYADEIRLDPGVPLYALFGGDVITGPSRILHHVSAVAPGPAYAQPGDQVTLSFTLLNATPLTDTFNLTATDSASWSLSGLPASITVEELGNRRLSLEVTVPADAQAGDANEITFMGTSQSDSQTSDQASALLIVTAPSEPMYRVYLPIVLR